MRRVLAIVALVGCYSPHPPAGAPCANGVCPEGLVCSPATRTCELTSVPVDAHTFHDGSRGIDAQQPDAAPVAIAFVQQVTGSAAGPVLSATLANAPKPGHVLVMIGAAEHGPLDGVSGGGVATWLRAVRSVQYTNVEIWYGVSDGSSSTVTITMATNTFPIWMSVSEWAGLAGTGTLDMASGNGGTASSASAGPVATAHPYDLLVFAVATDSGMAFTTSPTPGAWTALSPVVVSNNVTQAEWFRIVMTAGSYDPTVVVNDATTQWDAALAALRAP